MKRREELRKGHTEPSHSLFGVVGHICMETGWSVKYVLNKINVVQLSLMMADAPHYVEGKKMSPQDYIKELGKREKSKETNNNKETVRNGIDPLTFFNEYAIKD